MRALKPDTVNQGVAGSSPASGAIFHKGLRGFSFTRTVQYLTLCPILLLLGTAQAEPAPKDIEPPCAVLVVFTLETYDGPIVIEDVCFVSKSDAEGVLRITAREYFGDGIFRSNFDPATATMPVVPQMSR